MVEGREIGRADGDKLFEAGGSSNNMAEMGGVGEVSAQGRRGWMTGGVWCVGG